MQTLHLYNTLTNTLEPFTPADPAHVTFYTCGPTVYDDSHIGNFRAFLFADVLRRFLESPLCTVTAPDASAHQGPREVTHVINITDVGHMTDDAHADGGGEDKMALAGQRLLEAKKQGRLPPDANVDPEDPRAIAEFFAARFLEDAAKLGLQTAEQVRTKPKLAARLLPRASDHVDGMKAVIERLGENGFAYVAGEPGARAVYFDVQRFEQYGELSGNKLDRLKGGAGGRVSDANQSQKRHRADFLLWKEDAAHLMKWPGPTVDGVKLADGYPGWHIECTAMSLGSLIPGGLTRVMGTDQPATIDLHSGGEDNIFPHHECENAQSRALTGADRFARHWVHARYLFVDGQKMSKSKGTMHTPRELFEKGFEPAAVRLELIKTHYRANADFSLDGLHASAKMVERWRRVVEQGDASNTPGEPNTAVRDAFADELHNDLNIAGALGVLNAWINTLSTLNTPTKADAELVRTFDAVLGILDRPRLESRETAIGLFKGVDPDPEVERLLADRAEARRAKDFAAADAIRDQLAAKGLAIKDAPGGKVEVTRA